MYSVPDSVEEMMMEGLSFVEDLPVRRGRKNEEVIDLESETEMTQKVT